MNSNIKEIVEAIYLFLLCVILVGNGAIIQCTLDKRFPNCKIIWRRIMITSEFLVSLAAIILGKFTIFVLWLALALVTVLINIISKGE